MSQAIGFIFPGQGAQYAGMGRDVYLEFPAAREVFAQADAALGFALSEICFQGPKEKLTQSSICQPAIVTMSAAILAALRQDAQINVPPRICAGLSLGEYSALVACGGLSFSDAVRLVHTRGRLMDAAAQANPGTMICVLGVDLEKARTICAHSGTEIANLNCPGQIVLSGTHEAIAQAKTAAQEVGARKVIPLDVSGPFHCSLMSSAADGLRQALSGVSVQTPKTTFIPNVTAEPAGDPAEIAELLIRQVAHTTHWEQSVRRMQAMGVTTFWEIGPGNVLRGLLQRIDKSLQVINIESVADIAAIAAQAG